MTDQEKRLVLRGMSIARGILKNTFCSHHDIVRDYQEVLADAWDIRVQTPGLQRAEEGEFMALVVQINDAIERKHPDWKNRDGRPWRKQ